MKSTFPLLLMVAVAGGGSASSAVSEEQAVLTYHGHPDRSGNFVVPALNWQRAHSLRLDDHFHAPVSGHIYAQPLYWRAPGSRSGMLLVATEENTVYALDARTGHEIWNRSLGKPVTRSSLRCGNIDPLGVTGTPVIDVANDAIYLNAAVEVPSGPRHLIFALSLKDGSPLPGWPVDVADALQAQDQTFVPRDQGQRGALTILDGTLYVPFGGHFGDCGEYHGWVVGVSLRDPRKVTSWATRDAGGGIWAPGGISTDRQSLFVATGNTLDVEAWSDGEAILHLVPDLHRSNEKRDYFAPRAWRALDERDADLGGSHPVLLDLPTGNGTRDLVLALGKDGHAYLLDRHDLGGIGGSIVLEHVSIRPIRTAPATYPGTEGVFVAFGGEGVHCPTSIWGGHWVNNLRVARLIRKWINGGGNELTVLKIRAGTPPTIETAWCGALRGEGSPIVTTTDGHCMDP